MTSKMFKTQVEPQAAGEWLHCKVLSILWRQFWCRPWKIVVDLLFTITFIFLRRQPALRDMLRHFHGLFKQQTTLSMGLPA